MPLPDRILPWLTWWWGTGTLKPTKKLARVELALRGAALIAAVATGAAVTAEVRTTRPPPALPAESLEGATGSEGGSPMAERFGLPLAQRKQLFFDLAAEEPAARAKAAENFPDQPWSQEDDRAAQERDRVRDLADKRHLSVSQVYAILDEGIRAGWTGPNGQSLEAKVVPLQPRLR